MNPRQRRLYRENVTLFRKRWFGQAAKDLPLRLRQLSAEGLSVASGDLTWLDGNFYVTHSGLLRLAHRRRCAGIQVEQVDAFCDPSQSRWAFKALVYTRKTCRGFIGYGDADPSNVSPLVRGAEMRVAETRAVNRALRKAYGIGLCSVEEIGSRADQPVPAAPPRTVRKIAPATVSGNGNGQPRVRDRLLQLIRRYELDAELVKSYAADFCGATTLKDARREMVEEFVQKLAEQAEMDRAGLICRLNSYPRPREVAS